MDLRQKVQDPFSNIEEFGEFRSLRVFFIISRLSPVLGITKLFPRFSMGSTSASERLYLELRKYEIEKLIHILFFILFYDLGVKMIVLILV